MKKEDFYGVIYKRTLIAPTSVGTPDYGKVYVGQTDNLKERNISWNKANSHTYGGKKISEARKKYGVSSDAWKTEIIEEVHAATEEELKKKLSEKETAYIKQYNSVDNGFNSSYGNGMQGMKHSSASKAKISVNHRHNQTEEAKKKISKSLKGRKQTDEAKRKISEGNRGKRRTAEQRKAQSESKKGKEPVAASKALKEYIAKNGHGPTLGVKQSSQARANMKAAQQARGTKVRAIYPDGTTKEFNTMLDAAKECDLNVGSVASAVKTGGRCRNGMKFEKIA